MWKDICYLRTQVDSIDALHRPKKDYTERKVFCNVKSIGFSEFYQAQASGLKPEHKIVVKEIVSDNVTHVKLNNVIYKIIRKYPKTDITELVITSNLNG